MHDVTDAVHDVTDAVHARRHRRGACKVHADNMTSEVTQGVVEYAPAGGLMRASAYFSAAVPDYT